ncbi:MAG: hypothetical protein LC769_08770, partial [Chloroflexi bacterium]|nr:hypothetical protein [Chloroflexota bacterium]
SGAEAIRELRTFWTFLKREFRLANADACLLILDDAAARQLEQDLQDPAKFGVAKSMVMMGRARGFDMTTAEGSQAWIETYNAEQRANWQAASPTPLPEPSPRLTSAKKTDSTARRKMARESRKRNRKKK